MKKIHRFFIESVPLSERVTLTEKQIVFQMGTVLKLKSGEQVILFANGTDDVVYTLASLTKKEVVLQKHSTVAAVTKPKRVVIAAVSIVKRDLFELIVQKLTELGVTTIIPLLTDRTVKQSIRIERLQLISDEALELCGGNKRVTITEPLRLDECLTMFSCQTLFFDQEAPESLSSVPLGETVLMCIGPEGGWSDAEKTILSKKGQWVTLGDRTLRAETASIISAYHLLWNYYS